MNVLNTRIIAMLFVSTMFVAASSLAATPNDFVTLTNPKTGKSIVLSSVAVENLALVKDVAVELNIEEHIETLQAIMLVESTAGMGGSVGLPNAHWTRRSYGLMQIVIPTAIKMLERNPHLLERYFGDRQLQSLHHTEIKSLLLKDKRANITLGAIVFDLYLKMTKNDWARAVAAYNMGIGNALARQWAPKAKYVQDVRKMLGYIEQLNVVLAKREEITPTITDVENQQSSQISFGWQLPSEDWGVDIYRIFKDTFFTNKENSNGKRKENNTKTYQGEECFGRCERAQAVQDWTSNYYASPPDY